MKTRLRCGLALFGLLALTSLPAHAQEQSMACRLMPLACPPGPVPAPPPPLLGPPKEQADAAQAAPAPAMTHKRHARKHAAASK